MTRLLGRVLSSVVLLAGSWLGPVSGPRILRQSGILDEVLRTHGGADVIQHITSWRILATKLTPTVPPAFIERQVEVESSGGKFRRITVDPLGLRKQEESFDGQTGRYSVSGRSSPGKATTDDETSMDPGRLRAAAFQVAISGLIPILQTVASADNHPISEEPLAGHPERVRVKTRDGDLTLLTDHARRIRQVDIGNCTVQFADYRWVDGLQLPFIERVFIGKTLEYELVITKLEANPVFSGGHFAPARQPASSQR